MGRLEKKTMINGTVLIYSYDSQDLYTPDGQPYSLWYLADSTAEQKEWAAYYYIVNQQGDVIALTNVSGSVVAKYSYDAWGKVTSVRDASNNVISSSTHIGNINPIRYRGYYYDVDTQLYYLQSRYYNPEIGRFLNADAYASTGQGFAGTNMFSYCINNPTGRLDRGGNISAFCTLVSDMGANTGQLRKGLNAFYVQHPERVRNDTPISYMFSYKDNVTPTPLSEDFGLPKCNFDVGIDFGADPLNVSIAGIISMALSHFEIPFSDSTSTLVVDILSTNVGASVGTGGIQYSAGIYLAQASVRIPLGDEMYLKIGASLGLGSGVMSTEDSMEYSTAAGFGIMIGWES